MSAMRYNRGLSLLTLVVILCGQTVFGQPIPVVDVARVGTSTPDKELRVLAIIPDEKDGYYFPFGYEMSGGAILHALEVAKRDLLPEYSFVIDYVDTMCRPKLGLGRCFDLMKDRRYNVLIGPQCSNACALVGRLAAYLNIPVFAAVCQAVTMLDKTEFSTLTRFIGTFEMTGYALGHMFMDFNWRRAGIICEDHHADIIWKTLQPGIEYAFENMNITIPISTLTTPDMDLKEVLRKTAAVSRIIIIGMMGEPFRKMMIWAHEMGLNNGDYIIICVDFYKQKRVLGDFGWKQNDGYDEIVKEMYQAVIFVSYYNRIGSKVYQDFVKVVKEKSVYFNYIYNETENLPYQTLNLYEATLLYAVAINETLRDGGDINNGSAVARKVWDRSFPLASVTGDLTLNKNGDREQAYMIRHLQSIHDEEETLVAYYFGGNNSMVKLVPQITWPGGRKSPPLDTPPCGYEGEICLKEQQAKLFRMVTIFGGVLGALLVLVPVSVFLFYRRMRWEREVADMKWKVKYDDIVLSKGGAGASQLSMLSLKTSDSKITTSQNFIQTGTYKGVLVALKHLPHIKTVDQGNKTFLANMKKMLDLSHTNLCKFVGLTVDIGKIHLLTEYCVKGSLQDLLENTEIQLDWTFKCSIMNDMIQGLLYLHDSFLRQHGNLKSSNCVVDARFVVKLTDYGLPEWQENKEIRAQDLLWTPPELLVTTVSALPGTPKADIYATGVIIQEIVFREGPFYTGLDQYEAEEIIKKVQKYEKPPFRPEIEDDGCPKSIADLMVRCWDDDPQQRPPLSEIKTAVRSAGGMTGNFSILDNLLSRMEQYANNLEGLVEERTGKYMEEKKRAEDLLHRLLPPSIANEIQNQGIVAPVAYESVSIYFSDIVHFTALCSESTPLEVVDLLNDLYTMFDGTIAMFDVYKVETIGDAYMAVSGLPERNGDEHASQISQMALALLVAVQSFTVRHRPERKLLLRIGIHTGSCVAGVVGLTMPRYCLFGDTVNTASRMESNGEALKIHISTPTRDLLEASGDFVTEYRGEIPMKGKGNVPTYWLISGPPLPEQS